MKLKLQSDQGTGEEAVSVFEERNIYLRAVLTVETEGMEETSS